MLEFKSNKMAGTSRCKVVREHYSLEEQNDKNIVFDEAVAKKEAISAGLLYKEQLRLKRKPYGSTERDLMRKSLAAFLSKRYLEIEYPNKRTRQLHFEDALRETFRYLDDESRQLDTCYPTILDIFGVRVKDIDPDRIYINRKAGIV